MTSAVDPLSTATTLARVSNQLDNIFEEEEDEFWENVTLFLVEQYCINPLIPRPMRTKSFSGHALVHDILGGHEDRGYDLFRMSNHVFFRLRDALIGNDSLKPTRFLTCNEQLAIFLHAIGHAIPNRVLAELFQHSGETISRHFNNVLRAVLTLRQEFIQLPAADSPVHPRIRTNPGFYPYFKNALGAIDGTHVPAVVRKDHADRFRNRKNFVSQNVMAVCSFDHTFLYVASGWEGSAGDMRVLRWALDEGGFSVPEGKYYLVDSGYANSSRFLAPYRGLRYHLSSYVNHTRTSAYRSPRDKFNHRHAQLRNAVEKSFGILKGRFKILRHAIPYPFKTQCKLVIACCVIHNFIRRHQGDDKYFNMREGLEDVEEDSDDEDDPTVYFGTEESRRGDELRAAITTQLTQ